MRSSTGPHLFISDAFRHSLTVQNTFPLLIKIPLMGTRIIIIIMTLYVPAKAGVERSARSGSKSPRSECPSCSWTSPRGCSRCRMSVCKSRRSRGIPCSHPPLRWSGRYWHRTAQAGNGLICYRRNTLQQKSCLYRPKLELSAAHVRRAGRRSQSARHAAGCPRGGEAGVACRCASRAAREGGRAVTHPSVGRGGTGVARLRRATG